MQWLQQPLVLTKLMVMDLLKLTGIQGTLAVGQAVGGLKTPVDVTMSEMTLGFTPASLQQNTVESPTGVEATISIETKAQYLLKL